MKSTYTWNSQHNEIGHSVDFRVKWLTMDREAKNEDKSEQVNRNWAEKPGFEEPGF
jgi:hypothetical protein